MFDSLESFLLGLATVIDTVLLITLFERTNRPLVALWLKLLIGFAWLTHASSFVHVLLTTTPGNTALRLDQLSMFGLAIGLWCLPQAMLHAAIRLYHTGVATHPSLDRRYLGVYVPSLLLPWLAVLIATNESRSFLDSVEPVIYPYLVGVLLTNGVCAAIFFQLRHRIPVAGARNFFQQLSLMLIAMTILLVLFVTRFRDSEWDASVRLLTQLSPLFTVLLFAWYTFRHRLLPLVFERTLVYGASLTVVLLIHQFFVQPWTEKISEQAQFDFIWIEILALLAVILAWKPLRYRVLESLRYLLSNNVSKTRNATRRISLELSKRARQSPDAMKQWMESTLEQELGLEFARIWIVEQGSTTLQIPLVEAPGAVEKDLQSLFAIMEESPLSSIDRTEDCSKELFEMLVRLNTMAFSVFTSNR